MKLHVVIVLALVATLGVGVTARAEEAKPTVERVDGKSIFTKYRCRSCHSVQSEGIERKKADAEEESSGKKNKKEPPDLSAVGKEKKADWIAKFLLKKETLDGEKHQKAFRGSDGELKVVAAWLETLKTDVKKKGEKDKGKSDKSEKSESAKGKD